MFATVFPPRLTSFPLNTCTQSMPRATLRDFLAPFAKLMARAIHEMAAARGALPGRPPRADRPITPARQRHARARFERDRGPLGLGGREIVVAVPAGAWIVLPEVGEQERTTATGVFGVAAHHRQPRALHLVLTFRFRLRRLKRRGDAHRPGPADIPVHLPCCRTEIG